MSNDPKSPGYVEAEVYGPCSNCGYPRTAHEWKLPGRHCESYMPANPHPPVIDTREEVQAAEESFPRSARDWLKDALGRYQVTHCHSSIREALKAMDITESAPNTARLSHPEVAAQSNSPTCPLPLHNLLRQKDGTYKCSGCGKTWSEYPSVTVTYPKVRTK